MDTPQSRPEPIFPEAPVTTRITPDIVTVEVVVRLQALAALEPGGGCSVTVPATHGCVTQGETPEEARANVVEAAVGCLEVLHDRRKDGALARMAE
jgi:predicted RNase H-like HicB family nuclease